MLTLNVQIPKTALEALRGFNVALFQSVFEPVSVACAVIPILDVLPIRIHLEDDDFFFVDPMAPPYSGCRVLSPSLFSGPLVEGRRYAFNGTGFVDDGPMGADTQFCVALRNDHTVPLTAGTAKKIVARGEEARAPLNLRRLQPGMTTHFPSTTTYRLGVASLPNVAPRQGLILPTSILRAPGKQALPCAPTLGRFVDVPFADSKNQTAVYDVDRSAFEIHSVKFTR